MEIRCVPWEDPDNVVNLIDDPKYAEKANELRGALKDWQLEVRDCGLLPECERVKRAANLGITLYEMAQEKEHYDLQSYLCLLYTSPSPRDS